MVVSDELVLISDSDFFDETAYARAAEVEGDRLFLVRHYVEVGEGKSISPSAKFDVAFYHATNPQVAESGQTLLGHYLTSGRNRGRYATPAELARDAAIVRKSPIYDPALFRPYHRARAFNGAVDVEAFLLSMGKAELGPSFDGCFYVANYPELNTTAHRSIVHFAQRGLMEGRVGSEAELARRRDIVAGSFDAPHYLRQLEGDEEACRDPLRHYLLYGERLGLDPASDFSVDYYTRRYPDVPADGVSPFVHFVTEGKPEGRCGRRTWLDRMREGKRRYDPRRSTVVVVMHDATLSGAPMLGLMLCRNLSADGNVLVVLLEAGPLAERVKEYAVAVLIERVDDCDAEFLLKEMRTAYKVDALIANSSMTSAFVTGALYAGIPSVALVHEFAPYTLPPGRVTTAVELADRVVVADETIRVSAQAEVVDSRARPTNNMTVHVQGFLPRLQPFQEAPGLSASEMLQRMKVVHRKDVKIVLGAGTVEFRKGVGLFIEVAACLRQRYGDSMRFLWAGQKYREETADFCRWIDESVSRLHLDGVLFFFPPQIDFEVFFEVADVFFLSSLLDPLPNIALDVLKAGKRIVCFKQATGLVDILHKTPEYGETVPYCDVRAAADALVRQLEKPQISREVQATRSLEAQYAFANYCDHVRLALREAVRQRSHLVKTAADIAAADGFDGEFHEGVSYPLKDTQRYRAILAYVSRTMKGLLCLNPRPGFNQGAFRQNARHEAADEFRELSNNEPAWTHDCVILDDLPSPQASTLRVALHIHLHYPELASEFLTRVQALKQPMDLLITTTTTDGLAKIAKIFGGYREGRVELRRVPNRGRDIAPLVIELPRFINGRRYDVVGHLHGKRSIEAVEMFADNQVGNRWRRYLLNILLGDQDTFARLLGLFEGDPTLGLVFPEDRHCVGWQQNLSVAEELAESLEPLPSLSQFPLYPLGTMFWCRPAALASLWKRGFKTTDFPIEPLPYDGTLPHAIEAILPDVCKSHGFRWKTVYRRTFGW